MTVPLGESGPQGRSESPQRREQPTSLREATAARMVRWRIRLLLFSLAEIMLAQILVLAFLPFDARLFSVRLVCLAAVYLGAMPVAASLMQYLLVGLHRFRMPYKRLAPYYPNTAVIVPAWNEGAVIGATIDHLLSMEYPEERLRIVVVDDASTDETPDVVRAKMAEYGEGRVVHMRREKGGQGKAHTLNHGIQRVLADSWAQAVMIIDADVLFEKDALRKMTRHLSDPDVGAVTAYIKEGSARGNYLTRFIAFEYVTAQAAARRAQNLLGALACLAGGAQLHSRESLMAIGGRIDTSSLAEDTVTTFKTQLAGRRVEFEGNATVWAEEPGDVVGLWKQRLRWARGNVQISMQYASVWGKQRARFGSLGRLPFLLLWYSVLLMPVLMFGASVGLLVLYSINAAAAWAAFQALWLWHAVAYVFGTAVSLAIDPKTARRTWFEAIMFPGVVSLVIMGYSVFPNFYAVDLVLLLKNIGLVITPERQVFLTLFMYSWLFLCVPLAYMAKIWAQTPGYRWLAPLTIYVVGYGPFLCAITSASYFKELLNVTAAWDKTVKTGRVALGATRR